jgi:tetratricopeptide (TPR) repeat protein
VLQVTIIPEAVLKQNVKVIASLVRKAKKKLYQGKRDEALELMRKAVNIDDNNGVLIQVIRVIGRKKVKTDFNEDIDQEEEFGNGQDDDDGVITTPEPEPEIEPEPEPEIEAEPEEEYGSELEPEHQQPVEKKQERTASMAPEERLQKLFEASDTEYDRGHQQKAIAYLKKARQLAPDDPEVQERIDLLKTRIKSANLVQIALKKLESGEEAKAVVLAREAFRMFPDATGLDGLLSALEEGSPSRGTIHEAPAPQRRSGGTEEVSAEDYIAQVRQMVQDNSLVAAAELAERAFGIHPGNSLLSEFVENFRKLGLLD